MNILRRYFTLGLHLLFLVTANCTCQIANGSTILADARPSHGYFSSTTDITTASLPAEARATIDLIKRGGPFPYPRDGIVFKNFERRLPIRNMGYYHEYTVATPNMSTRGAKRIITGQTGEMYYTEDHYRTFRQIRQ